MTTEVAACQHRWLIESPNGPTSPARCRVCGETRDYFNADQRLRKLTKTAKGSQKQCVTCQVWKKATLTFWPRSTFQGELDNTCRSCLSEATV